MPQLTKKQIEARAGASLRLKDLIRNAREKTCKITQNENETDKDTDKDEVVYFNEPEEQEPEEQAEYNMAEPEQEEAEETSGAEVRQARQPLAVWRPWIQFHLLWNNE